MIDRLMRLDRRVIFLFIFLGVAIPLLLDFHFPIKATPPVRSVFAQIERVAATDGTVLISFDYGPGSEAELQPMARATLRHCFSRGVKVVAICLWPDAPGLAQEAIAQAAKEYDRVAGRDYAFMGYKAGGASVVMNMGQDFRTAFPQDAWGNSVDTLAAVQKIHSLRDFSFVLSLAAGNTIDQVWIPYGQEKHRFPLAGGCTAVMAPDLFPFLQSRQLIGLIGGLAGAAEYEELIKHPDVATTGMRPQSIAHLILIGFILLGNVMYFLSRRANRQATPGSH